MVAHSRGPISIPGPVRVGFLVEKLSLWQVSLPVPLFSLVIIISPMTPYLPLICHGRYWMLAVDSDGTKHFKDVRSTPTLYYTCYVIFCHLRQVLSNAFVPSYTALKSCMNLLPDACYMPSLFNPPPSGDPNDSHTSVSSSMSSSLSPLSLPTP